MPVGLSAYFVLGPVGLVLAIALIEVPPYFYLCTMLRRIDLFDFRRELLPWVAMASGAGLGLVCLAAANRLAPV
jgi:hypothetical protein